MVAWSAIGGLGHHADAYNEMAGSTAAAVNLYYDSVADTVTVLSQAITITRTCCVVAVGTILADYSYAVTAFELEQPKGTIVVDQEDVVRTNDLSLFHYASWRVLKAGTYTFCLVNRRGGVCAVYAAELKVVAVEG